MFFSVRNKGRGIRIDVSSLNDSSKRQKSVKKSKTDERTKKQYLSNKVSKLNNKKNKNKSYKDPFVVMYEDQQQTLKNIGYYDTDNGLDLSTTKSNKQYLSNKVAKLSRK